MTWKHMAKGSLIGNLRISFQLSEPKSQMVRSAETLVIFDSTGHEMV